MKIYDCSNSIERPENRCYGGTVENAVVSMLKKYGHKHDVFFVENPTECDLLFTNDIFPDNVLSLKKPKIKRMDGIFWSEELEDRNELYNKAAQQANHVIFISEFSKKSLAGLYNIRPSCSVVVNWVDNEMFYPAKRNVKVPKRFVSICTSWEREEKRFNDTLAFSKILDGQLFLIGNYKSKKVPPNVTMLGYVEYNNLGGMLRQMDAMINLSYRDACPKVIPEAICCGLPVLYADSGGAKEMVKGTGTAIIDPFDFVFESKTPKLNIKEIQKSYDLFLNNYETYRQNALNVESKPIVEQYCNIFRKFDAR